jgi:hypothetical protein
MDAILW